MLLGEYFMMFGSHSAFISMIQQLKMKTLRAFETLKNPHSTAQLQETQNFGTIFMGLVTDETFSDKCTQAVLHVFSSKSRFTGPP